MYRDTWAEVDLDCIRTNMRTIRRKLPRAVKMMAVVKADGYGHGAIEAAGAAVQGGADCLGVAYLDEALHLRDAGIKLPILILTPIRPEHVSVAIEHDLMLTVTSSSWMKEMRAYKPEKSFGRLQLHVKCDTGLGRIGLRTRQEWLELAPWLRASDIEVDGFYTHFATAGQEDTSYLQQQAGRFLTMMEWAKQSGLAIGHYHCAGSAAALRFPYLAMDMVRIGAAIYGFYPDKLVPHIRLRPALSLRSRLIQVKKLGKGECVGYDNSYVAEEDQWIGTVPIGYADGWTQSMQGTEMLIGGRRAKVVGKISMDQLMVKLPCWVSEGTQVTLIGSQGGDSLTCKELAGSTGRVSQEVSSSLTSRVERVYIQAEGNQHVWNVNTAKAGLMS
ncbi:alanine racemase [Paenibacillus pasadenensis]|uniref:alanine racemase n=1 Tax=Paenibacillus pasadenensis TaxID=217090 RepID=UPI0020416B8C|nr:alanine racemase [Paenibacillus pasadenensis]MCM3749224.1 alanine racemase [Paenibacillus pasadenensis]